MQNGDKSVCLLVMTVFVGYTVSKVIFKYDEDILALHIGIKGKKTLEKSIVFFTHPFVGYCFDIKCNVIMLHGISFLKANRELYRYSSIFL